MVVSSTRHEGMVQVFQMARRCSARGYIYNVKVLPILIDGYKRGACWSTHLVVHIGMYVPHLGHVDPNATFLKPCSCIWNTFGMHMVYIS